MDQISMWGLNIYVGIGFLIVLVVGGLLLVGLWTGLRAWLWHARSRRSRQAWHRRTHRADGGLYPPVAEGVCQSCGRGHRTIYLPSGGERLCPPCYEVFWRQAESWTDEAEREPKEQMALP